MKYTTFRNLLLVGGVSAVVAAGAYACSRGSSGSSASGLPSSSASAPPAPATVLVVTPPDPSPAASAPATVGATPAGTAKSDLRPVDRDILAWRKTAVMSGDKVKDVFPGKPYKVDAYKDEGKSGVSRVKIDLDRDGKWDEKWDFEGDKVKRKVAPADDENYQLELRLDGDHWRPKT